MTCFNLCERRMFSYTHKGKEHWLGISACESLRQGGGTKKAIPAFDDGETGEGEVEIGGVIFTKTFTCVEP